MWQSGWKWKTVSLLGSWTILFLLLPCAISQQVTIGRIEEMPNMPTPYQMRNWKHVARGYDSLVFNLNLSGQYLPLIRLITNTVNYPDHGSFGLHTVVGTTVPYSSEAINVLPAVIGASLVGIDKRNQNGRDWVLMCEEYFNRRPEENVYLNHPVTSSGSDWWYDTMPNVFFYQLYSLHPGTGDFQFQFRSVADRWLQALEAMGGSATPWRFPNMNYRAFRLSTMTPRTTGVVEPEAAGAIAWLLYNAFVKTGEHRYRIGAEWALEFLNNLTTNPSYELQLPYGASVAARMNAELGTTYDVEKLVRWCFDIGQLRSWGVIVGKWASQDVSGIVGEVNGFNDYAFAMNTFEHIGALVPLVRYDDRFARAIGKWVLNAANAARLFYPNALPDQNQDNSSWSKQHDPYSSIAYEALRQSVGGRSPYGTGDAVSGGWGMTNLALYGSSHVGILGGIIDTTNVEMILRLDLLKTDYFHGAAYPSFLYFNPHAEAKLVTLDVGAGSHDLYDAVSNSFLVLGATDTASFAVQANSAVVLVLAPSGGSVTHSLGKTLINGVVVDFRSDQVVANHSPRVKSLVPKSPVLLRQQTTQVFCTATDRDGDTLLYSWGADAGLIFGDGSQVSWVAPDSVGVFSIFCQVTDGRGGQVSDTAKVQVVEVLPTVPKINSIKARPGKINIGSTTELTCLAVDSSGSELSYSWSADFGTLMGSGPVVQWTAPMTPANYYAKCTVENVSGGKAIDSVGIVVRDFSLQPTGQLVAYYPFDGNAADASGNGHHGSVTGALLAPDRNNRLNSAYFFNGVDDYVRVANTPALNFEQAITVSFWMRLDTFYEREQHPISHGSWENRWKVSISNKRLRWTVKTTSGIKDLDSRTQLVLNTYYHVAVLYGGGDMEIYLNGELDAFSSFSGTILPTTIDLMIGQVLPTNSGYNFRGTMDEVRVYNYPLSVQEIMRLFDDVTSVDGPDLPLPSDYVLYQNYPNPFNPRTVIPFDLPARGHVSVKVSDLLGREVRSLDAGYREAGRHEIVFESRGIASGVYYYTISVNGRLLTKKMVVLQ